MEPGSRDQDPAALVYFPADAAWADCFREKEKNAMFPTLSKPASLAAAIMLLSSLGSAPVLADEPTVVEQPEAGSNLSTLLKNILGDPERNFSRYQGPDDCATERLYLDTRDLLGNYAAAPEQHQKALRDYILANKPQCNCTRAIIGKDFDILVDAVGSDLSQVPCP
jgi:hypothetical protein